jgi:hypothetical protein
MEYKSTDELNVEVAHVEDAPAPLAYHREGLGEDAVELLACRQARSELGRLVSELPVGEGSKGRLELADALEQRAYALQLALVLGAEDLGEDDVQHDSCGLPLQAIDQTMADGKEGEDGTLRQSPWETRTRAGTAAITG